MPAPDREPVEFYIPHVDQERLASINELFRAHLQANPVNPVNPIQPIAEAWDEDEDEDDDWMDRDDGVQVIDESAPMPTRSTRDRDRIWTPPSPQVQPAQPSPTCPDLRHSIFCPKHRTPDNVIVSGQAQAPQTSIVEGQATCMRCSLAFSFSCDIVRGVGASRSRSHSFSFQIQPPSEPVTMPITKVFVVHDPSEQEILGVYTSNKWPNMLTAYGCKTTEFSVEPQNQTAFVVYIAMTNDDNYRIVKVTTDREVAKNIATSINGIVTMREALPEDRRPREVRFYQYYVLLDSDGEVVYNESRHRMKKLLPTETISYIVTHRRAYQTMTPHRLEVIGPDRDRCNDLANHVAEMTEGKSRAQVEELFEFNVDVSFKYGPNGWELCQADVQSTA